MHLECLTALFHHSGGEVCVIGRYLNCGERWIAVRRCTNTLDSILGTRVQLFVIQKRYPFQAM